MSNLNGRYAALDCRNQKCGASMLLLLAGSHQRVAMDIDGKEIVCPRCRAPHLGVNDHGSPAVDILIPVIKGVG